MQRNLIILPAFFLFSIVAFNLPDKNKKLPENAAELGKLLFFDPILSLNKTVSCASCHKPEFAFADTAALSAGFNGKLTSRNTPSAMNVLQRSVLFWDGRSPNLEDQALHPMKNPVEMGMTESGILKRLKKNKFYKAAFRKIYEQEATLKNLGNAIAAFERTLETGDSPFDDFLNGDSSAVSVSAMRGRIIFVEKAHCFECHFTPDFTADEFKNIGLFNARELNDSGRFSVTKIPEDIGKFKVPGLRNVALTAPYMHNGIFRNLETVIEYYNNPNLFLPDAIGRDSLLNTPLNLSGIEKADLLAFLQSLTSKSLVK